MRSNMTTDLNSKQEGEKEEKGVLRKALELFASDEKSAADREAKLAVLRFIAALEGRGDEYLRGYREGYVAGFRDGYALRITEEEMEGQKYGAD